MSNIRITDEVLTGPRSLGLIVEWSESGAEYDSSPEAQSEQNKVGSIFGSAKRSAAQRGQDEVYSAYYPASLYTLCQTSA